MLDADIIELYHARSEAAIEETRRSYGGRLHALASRILGSSEDAQECENDTYLAAWNAIPPARPQHFFAYLAKICRNEALSRLEKRSAAKRSAEIVELTEEMSLCIPDEAAQRAFEPQELGLLLNAFLDSERREARVIFVRRYLLCESVEEVSEALGVSRSKVKSSLMRTRERLRRFLKDRGYEI